MKIKEKVQGELVTEIIFKSSHCYCHNHLQLLSKFNCD